MPIESWEYAAVGVALCVAIVSGQTESADPSALWFRNSCGSHQANIDFAPPLLDVIARLYERSPTFKSQCDRLVRAKHLQVRVRLSSWLPSRCRALTRIRRHRGIVHADVEVRPGRELIELLGHEFEHLLEQAEGLNLRMLRRIPDSGVHEIDRDVFETDRAIRAGLVVARESKLGARAD